jgi:Bacterial archaeo-eukaryotic release factor family 3
MNCDNKTQVPGKRLNVKLNTHYYVLSLGEHTSRLYEAFRDTLVDILNKGFPIESSADLSGTVAAAQGHSQSQEFVRTADEHFDHYFRQDPLPLVVVGEKNRLSMFGSVTSHQDVVIGKVEGNYIATSPHDLGRIVWAIVKEAMAGASEQAMHDLEKAGRMHNVASGIEAVAHLTGSETGGSLFVEEDYRVKGSIDKADHSLIMPENLDIREVTDDAVDAIIEKVLCKDGHVVFLESGSLTNFQKIAFIKTG